MIQHSNEITGELFAIWSKWQQTRRVSLILCRLQQRLEARLLRDPMSFAPSMRETYSLTICETNKTYRIAKEAEELVTKELLGLRESVAAVQGQTTGDIAVKLEMILGDHDIDDRFAFPALHIMSVLRDLKTSVEPPLFRYDRTKTRSDIMRFWDAATKVVVGRTAAIVDARESETEERRRDNL